MPGPRLKVFSQQGRNRLRSHCLELHSKVTLCSLRVCNTLSRFLCFSPSLKVVMRFEYLTSVLSTPRGECSVKKKKSAIRSLKIHGIYPKMREENVAKLFLFPSIQSTFPRRRGKCLQLSWSKVGHSFNTYRFHVFTHSTPKKYIEQQKLDPGGFSVFLVCVFLHWKVWVCACVGAYCVFVSPCTSQWTKIC